MTSSTDLYKVDHRMRENGEWKPYNVKQRHGYKRLGSCQLISSQNVNSKRGERYLQFTDGIVRFKSRARISYKTFQYGGDQD